MLLCMLSLVATGLTDAAILSPFRNTLAPASTKWSLSFPLHSATPHHLGSLQPVGPVIEQPSTTPVVNDGFDGDFYLQPTFSPDLEASPSPELELSMSPQIDNMNFRFDFDSGAGVRLQASDFTVSVAGRTFSPTGAVELNGDPGWSYTADQEGYTTFELVWFEQNVEMRVNLYFASNSTHWWISEIRTYDGADPGEWITSLGRYVETPLGQPFKGDLHVRTLLIEGMVLDAFIPDEVDDHQ